VRRSQEHVEEGDWIWFTDCTKKTTKHEYSKTTNRPGSGGSEGDSRGGGKGAGSGAGDTATPASDPKPVRL
jgi:hypothetical protein